jgi:hypothetical protein
MVKTSPFSAIDRAAARKIAIEASPAAHSYEEDILNG